MNQNQNIQETTHNVDDELTASELWRKIMFGTSKRLFVDGNSIIEREIKTFEQKLEAAIENQINDQY
ncbi:hypothetical protein PDL71_15215 [Lacibacter sp. MH-610]|uniref:hypothetical protein n=1 Tax=Lacibacter sp. MH-610 TaxID=3020883 RepID=UPI0038929DF5